VDRAGATVLVWSLIDAAKAVLAPEAQMWLCVKIGAGDEVAAIEELLLILADQVVVLPEELSAPAWDWVYGYLGSDSEPRFRSLLARLGVPEPPRVSAAEPAPQPPPFERRPRRVSYGLAQTVSLARTAHLDPAKVAHPLHHNGLRSRQTSATTTMKVLVEPTHFIAKTTI
jgi:hypothetical protein